MKKTEPTPPSISTALIFAASEQDAAAQCLIDYGVPALKIWERPQHGRPAYLVAFYDAAAPRNQEGEK